MYSQCNECPLAYHRKVPAYGPVSTPLMIVGEAPGEEDAKQGVPFVGDAGLGYLQRAGVDRSIARISNVIKCRPTKKGDPTPIMLKCCEENLLEELLETNPQVVAAVGAFASRWFIGDKWKMKYCHGLPYRVSTLPNGYPLPTPVIVIPCYHPAYALSSTSVMTECEADFHMVGNVLRQESRVEIRDLSPEPTLVQAYSTADVCPDIKSCTHIAIDTETRPDGSVICLTYTVDGEIGYRTEADDFLITRYLDKIVSNPKVLTIFHNVLFDLPKLHSIGIYPANYTDTMSMAYLLQTYSKGLKPLAYRLLNFVMRKYMDVIGPYTEERALEWLDKALSHTYPNPDPYLAIDGKGITVVKQPQNIHKKLKRAFNDYCKGTVASIYTRLRSMDGIEVAEAVVGPLTEADISYVDFDLATQYACADAIATYRCYTLLSKEIEDNHLSSTLARDMGTIPAIDEMQSTGFLVDVGHFHSLTEKYTRLMEEVEQEVGDKYHTPVNLNSPVQVANLLYSLGVFKSRTESTRADNLDQYRLRHPEIIGYISRYRELKKLISTYTSTLPGLVNSQGRISTHLSITGTTTGRLASFNPNLMNIPKRTKEGKDIRNGFIASPGCVLLSNDYSQIEMRVAAHMSHDVRMIDIFLSGVDIHSQTAAWMYGVPIDQVDPDEHRRPAKAVGFGILYGMSAKKMYRSFVGKGINTTLQKCQEDIYRWFGVFEGIKKFMDQVHCDARRYNRVWDLFGRYRLVPETKSELPRIVAAGLRQGGNAPIQSSAQGIIKEAMCLLPPVIADLRQGGRYIARFIIQIHDDLVFEVSEEIKEEAAERIREVMENCVELVVPTPVDSKWARKWGDL